MEGHTRSKLRPIGRVESMSADSYHRREMGRKKTSRRKDAGAIEVSSRFGKMLDRLKPNDHLALIYESVVEWREIVIPFVTSGLTRGERCLYLLGRRPAEKIRAYLAEEDTNVAAAEAAGQLLIRGYTDFFPAGGHLDPGSAVTSIGAAAKKAKAEGYSGLRVTTGAGALRWNRDADAILEYEARLNRDLFPKHPCSALCQYDRWECAPDVLKNAIFTHPLLIRSNEIHRNFYYIPPEELLGQSRDESEVQDMLNSIEQEGETQKRVRFLADVLDRSLQPFCALYPDGHVMFCNPAFSRLTGYTEEKLRTVSLMKDLLSLDGDYLIEGEMERTGEPSGIQTFEGELVRRNGSFVPTEVFLHAIHDGEGNLQYYYAFITDISERRRGRETLRSREEKLRA